MTSALRQAIEGAIPQVVFALPMTLVDEAERVISQSKAIAECLPAETGAERAVIVALVQNLQRLREIMITQEKFA